MTTQVLCVDIGGSRIKSAILPVRTESIDAVATTRVFAMRTLGWMNHSLPDLLNKNLWTSLTHPQRQLKLFNSVAIALPGPVQSDGAFDRQDLWRNGVPRNMKQQFSKYVGCRVEVVNDAEAWLRGALVYSDLTSRKIRFPCLAIVLGTGVGLAGASSPDDISQIEVSGLPNNYPSLTKAASASIKESWHVHRVIGNRFFAWVGEEKKKWDYLRIREEYTDRLIAFLDDLNALIPDRFRFPKTLFLCGGNAEYASVRGIEKRSKGLVVSPLRYEEEFQLNTPDLVPLLGLASTFRQVPVIANDS